MLLFNPPHGITLRDVSCQPMKLVNLADLQITSKMCIQLYQIPSGINH